MSSFLPSEDVDGVFSFTMILMMISTRVSLINLALTQCRNLFKLIQSLLNHHNTNGNNNSSSWKERTTKEALSLIDTLAVTLHSKRHYLHPLTAAADNGNGSSTGIRFEVDPRFLLFEFCHGLLLRESQVELVRKLVSRMQVSQ